MSDKLDTIAYDSALDELPTVRDILVGTYKRGYTDGEDNIKRDKSFNLDLDEYHCMEKLCDCIRIIYLLDMDTRFKLFEHREVNEIIESHDGQTMCKIINNYIMKKFNIVDGEFDIEQAYYMLQKEKENVVLLNVGDEICYNDNENERYVIVKVVEPLGDDGGRYYVLSPSGLPTSISVSKFFDDFYYTGRHFDQVENMLNKMQNYEES